LPDESDYSRRERKIGTNPNDFRLLGEAFAELSSALLGASETLLELGQAAASPTQPFTVPKETLFKLGDTFFVLSTSLSSASEGLLLPLARHTPDTLGDRCPDDSD
jgi:hypothetical protein